MQPAPAAPLSALRHAPPAPGPGPGVRDAVSLEPASFLTPIGSSSPFPNTSRANRSRIALHSAARNGNVSRRLALVRPARRRLCRRRALCPVSRRLAGLRRLLSRVPCSWHLPKEARPHPHRWRRAAGSGNVGLASQTSLRRPVIFARPRTQALLRRTALCRRTSMTDLCLVLL